VTTIKTLYVLNHSHTDIGFTDYQDVVFGQHARFIDQALDLCEATADDPPESRFHWTCEVTGPTERYLDRASHEQRRRFLEWHRRGQIDVGAMQYNLTPLLDVEQMHRSLQAIRRLRERYGLEITTAMQSDVNGVSWLFADLLPEVGVDFLSMAINPMRGGVPKPYPSAFWWEGPSGRRLLVWNGFHYLYGRSVLKLGDWRFAEAAVEKAVKKLEQREDYPFDFLFFQSTHPMRVDNGPPDPEIVRFARRWNELGKTPRIQLVGHRQFGATLAQAAAEHAEGAAGIPTLRGEWMDWWCDGVASSALETAVARQAGHLLVSAETLQAWPRLGGPGGRSPAEYSRDEAKEAFELATLYNEHTWGAYASVAAPDAWWSRGQENHKMGYAHRAVWRAHDMLARTVTAIADELSDPGPSGRFNLGDLAPEVAYPVEPDRALLVLNSLPWERPVIVDEPELRGSAAPAGVLDMFFPRGVPWGGEKPPTEAVTYQGTVPGWGFAFLRQAPHAAPELRAAGRSIESDIYRVTVDEETGGLAEWTDKRSGLSLAGTHEGWRLGQYVYEALTDPDARDQLFAADFSAADFGSWGAHVPLRREGPTAVKLHPPEVRAGRARLAVDVMAPGIARGTCVYTLWSGAPRVDVEWTIDKLAVEEAESVYFAFPFDLPEARFVGDFNGLASVPEEEQLPGSVKAWYPVHHWVGVDGGDRGVVVAPLDAPLVQLGGIHTGTVVDRLPARPVVMSWAMNNHWPVNFKAAQGGVATFRYGLTSTPGGLDAAAAHRFAAELHEPPLVLRDRLRPRSESGQVAEVRQGAEAVVGCKINEDGPGVVLRLLNQSRQSTQVVVDFQRPVRKAAWLSPDERPQARPSADLEALETQGTTVRATLPARRLASVLVRW